LQVEECQQSRLLNDLDVSLCNIDNVYNIFRDKKRKLIGGNNIDSKIKGLLIVCKVNIFIWIYFGPNCRLLFQNMRTLFFSFKFSNVNSGKNIANALLHYAYPRKHHLLFAYDFRYAYSKVLQNSNAIRLILISQRTVFTK
jgi:myotubularin-related protein 10/11/12